MSRSNLLMCFTASPAAAPEKSSTVFAMRLDEFTPTAANLYPGCITSGTTARSSAATTCNSWKCRCR